MSTAIISPIVVVDTSSTNPQIVSQSTSNIGVATQVQVV